MGCPQIAGHAHCLVRTYPQPDQDPAGDILVNLSSFQGLAHIAATVQLSAMVCRLPQLMAMACPLLYRVKLVPCRRRLPYVHVCSTWRLHCGWHVTVTIIGGLPVRNRAHLPGSVQDVTALPVTLLISLILPRLSVLVLLIVSRLGFPPYRPTGLRHGRSLFPKCFHSSFCRIYHPHHPHLAW